MHRAPVATTSLDFFSPHLRGHYDASISEQFVDSRPRSDLRSSLPRTTCRKDTTSTWLSAVTLGPPHVASVYLEAPVRDGLRTPPSDEMNSTAAYPQPYTGRKDNLYSNNPYTNHSALTQPQTTSTQPNHSLNASGLSSVVAASTQVYLQARSPQNTSTAILSTEDSLRKKSVILPSLQIPASINNSGGSLGEFAAQITCLFWFESTATLRRAEEWSTASSPVKRLVPDAIPTVSFRKWVVTILSTTQVTQNVILLALLFIYRLKTLNPTVKGKAGSEYRLLTVALMLGNKFLDDNTYTNKTWAEVSGISVGEIHVMEVEFLSNMRYSLLASKEQWKEWQTKLGKFWEYFERAARVLSSASSPLHASHPSLLPSPPTSMESSPPALTTYPPNSAPYNYNPTWHANYPQPGISPLPSMPDLVPELNLQLTGRKRGFEESTNEPPLKRAMRSNGSQMAPHSSLPVSRQNLPRLPVPSLSVTTTQTNGFPAVPQNLPLLPPLVGSRAMSTVYPTTPSWTPQSQNSLTPTTTTNHSASQVLNGSNYGTPSRRHSPRSVQDVLSMTSSPISGNFPNSAHNLNSPSFFLQQRSSPYKPVRPPNTLLYPPPSMSMHNFLTNIDQMHYQPLGKRNDYRSGVVPEYASHTPYQNWPPLPQPNFQA